MTRIRMDWEQMALTAEGHAAGGGPAGQNIICAGISAITQALLNYLMEEEAVGHVKLTWHMSEKNGTLRIRAKPEAGHWRTTKACYRMTMTGLKAIRENYPDEIEIEEVKGNGIV